MGNIQTTHSHYTTLHYTTQMNRVFGKKKAPGHTPAPGLDQVSGHMNTRLGELETKIGKIDTEIRSYHEKVRTRKSPAVKKNLKKRALDVLKRKRVYETQRDNLAAQQFNIDQAALCLESAKASVDMVAAMKAVNAELKKTVQKDLDINGTEDLTDDMAEMMEEFNVINEALGWSFSTLEEIDETDLEAELDLLG